MVKRNYTVQFSYGGRSTLALFKVIEFLKQPKDLMRY